MAISVASAGVLGLDGCSGLLDDFRRAVRQSGFAERTDAVGGDFFQVSVPGLGRVTPWPGVSTKQNRHHRHYSS